MSCLFCTYYLAIEPPQHREQRLAGTCPDGCAAHAGWNPGDAMRYVKRTNENLAGQCHVEAAALQKRCSDICGKFELTEKGVPYNLEVRPRKPGEHLHEWAREQMLLWVRGQPRDRWLEMAQSEARRAKRELAVARKRSAARLARLKQLEAKPLKQKPRLRLVHRLAEPEVFGPPVPLPMSDAAD
jgi:hypothetical protein